MTSVHCPSCRSPYEFEDKPDFDGEVVACPSCGATYELRHGSGRWLALAISLPSQEGSPSAGMVDVARPAAEMPPPILSEEDVVVALDDEAQDVADEEEDDDDDDLLGLPQPRPRGPAAEASASAVFAPSGLRPSQPAETEPAAENEGWDDFGDLDLPSPRRRGEGASDHAFEEISEGSRSNAEILMDAIQSEDLPALKIETGEAFAEGGEVGDQSFGAVDLDINPAVASPSESDDSPPSEMGFGEIDLGQDVGGEVNINALQTETPEQKLAPPERIREMPMTPRRTERVVASNEEPARSSGGRALVIMASLIGLLVVGGLTLGLTPYGVFGIYYLEQYLAASGDPQTIGEIIERAEVQVSADDYQQTRSGVYGLGRARQEYSLSRRLATRTIVHEALFAARFGGDAQLAGRVGAIFRRIEERGGEAPGLALARAADALREGRLSAAQGYLREAQAEAEGDPWVKILGGELALAEGDADAALVSFRAAEESGGGVRASWGVARALRGQGAAPEELQGLVDAVVEANPNHGDAWLLGAELSLVQGDRERARAQAGRAAGMPDEDGDRLRPARVTRAGGFTVLGDLASEVGDWRTAGMRYEQALAVEGLYAPALLGAGRAFIEERQWHDALVRFDSVRENSERLMGIQLGRGDEVSLEAALGAAEAMIHLDRRRDALALMESLRQEQPDERRVQLWLARAQQSIGETQAAETSFRTILRANPDWLDANLALSEVLHATGRVEEASEQLRVAAGRVTMNAAATRQLAAAKLAQGDLDGAVRDFERSLGLEPDYAPSRFGLAVALRRQGNLGGAEEQLLRLTELSPAHPGLAVERGRLYEQQGQSERAVQSYRAALESAPEDVDLRLRLGVAQALAGESDEALENLSAVLRERSNSAEAEYFLGRVYLGRGNQELAMRHFERAAALDPAQAEYHLYIARASLARAGQIDLGRVLRAAEAAVALDPMLADVYWVRAEASHRLGSVQDALADIERALELDPDSANAHAVHGEIRSQLGDWQEASAAYARAVEIDDSQTDWWYRLGKLRFDNRQYADARSSLERAIAGFGEGSENLPSWVAEAHRMLGELARRERRMPDAIANWRRYLELSNQQAIDRVEVLRALERAGVDPETLPVM